MLHPDARALMDLMASRGIPPVHTQTPVQARQSYHERRRFVQPDAPEVAQVLELLAPGPGGPVPVRYYRPLGSTPTTALPLLAYYHGGGWTVGDRDTHDVLCRQLSNLSGCALASVDYRLGPEHPFPAAFEDCLAATRFLRNEADRLVLDASRIAVGGDSAGGNLAAAVSLAARDSGDLPIAYQLLIYPATDFRLGSASHQTNGQGYMLTRDSILYYRNNYLPDPQAALDWRASPLLAASHAGLPAALVLTAGFDPLRDEGAQYAEVLTAAGNRCTYVCFERQIHGFITMGRVIDEANTAVDLCAAALRSALR